jgi:hypothetical protein
MIERTQASPRDEWSMHRPSFRKSIIYNHNVCDQVYLTTRHLDPIEPTQTRGQRGISVATLRWDSRQQFPVKCSPVRQCRFPPTLHCTSPNYITYHPALSIENSRWPFWIRRPLPIPGRTGTAVTPYIIFSTKKTICRYKRILHATFIDTYPMIHPMSRLRCKVQAPGKKV